MGWLSPPTRREFSLLLFSFTVFIFAYNLDITLSPHNIVFRNLGLAGSSVIGKDGRRPPGWRDRLENAIFGEWRWDEWHVAGEGGPDRRREKGTDRYGAQWLGRVEIGDVANEVYGTTTTDDAIVRWGTDIPVTTLVKHVPGYTILDGAIILNGAVYIVTDDYEAFPPPTSIMTQKHGSVIEILSKEQAPTYIWDYAGKISGVTFLSNDLIPDNSTLISLWRTYSSLDSSIDALGYTTLPPPRRLIFPRLPAFSDTHLVDLLDLSVPRTRSLTGFHPYLARAAFPTLEIMYQKDWMDYHLMDVPFILERLVIADRAVARRMGHRPSFSPPFEGLETSKHWWEPIRRTLTAYLEVQEDDGKKQKPVVTYISCQADRGRLWLKDTDHEALVKELKKMGRSHGYEIFVLTEKTAWRHRMTAIARSTVILGVHGDHLADAMFAKPSPRTTLLEFFPDGSFARDYQVLMKSIGAHYIWSWSERIFNEGSLPPLSAPRTPQEVSIDVLSLVRTIRDVLQN